MEFSFQQTDILPSTHQVGFIVTSVPHNYVPRHWHHALEVLYLLSGSLEVTVEDTEVTLYAGDGIIINPQAVHANINRHGNEAIVLLIPTTFIQHYATMPQGLVFPDFSTSRNASALKELLLKMRDAYSKEKDTPQFTFYTLVLEFLNLLYQEAHISPAPQPQLSANRQEQQLGLIISYINDHYTQHISLSEIAQVAHLQPQYFCRFFKRAMGQTFREYLDELRLSKIYLDLINTTDTIQDIRMKHGFTNYKVFRRLFFEKFQCTPTQLRQRYGQQVPSTD